MTRHSQKWWRWRKSKCSEKAPLPLFSSFCCYRAKSSQSQAVRPTVVPAGNQGFVPWCPGPKHVRVILGIRRGSGLYWPVNFANGMAVALEAFGVRAIYIFYTFGRFVLKFRFPVGNYRHGRLRSHKFTGGGISALPACIYHNFITLESPSVFRGPDYKKLRGCYCHGGDFWPKWDIFRLKRPPFGLHHSKRAK
jgi:hypothetical protein